MVNVQSCRSTLLLLTALLSIKCSSGDCSGYKDGAIRFEANTTLQGSGHIVQICLGHTWTYICDSVMYWDLRDATVACREMGYDRGDVVPGTRLTLGIYYIMKCAGIETALTRCSNRMVSRQNCYKATVLCSRLTQNDNCSDGEVSKAGDKETLLVCVSGIWRKLCSRYWSNEQSMVACRQLKRSRERNVSSIAVVTAPFYQIHYHCDGSEDRLTECSVTEISQSGLCSPAVDNRFYNCSYESSSVSSSVQVQATESVDLIADSQIQATISWIGGVAIGVAITLIAMTVVLVVILILMKRHNNKIKSTSNTQAVGDYETSDMDMGNIYFTLEKTQDSGANNGQGINSVEKQLVLSPVTATCDNSNCHSPYDIPYTRGQTDTTSAVQVNSEEMSDYDKTCHVAPSHSNERAVIPVPTDNMYSKLNNN